MKHFLWIAAALVTASCSVKPEPQAMVKTAEKFGCKTEYFFYDIKGGPSSLNDREIAHKLFYEDGMNGIRCSIYGNIDAGGHPQEGVVEPEAYSKMILSIKNAKEEAEAAGVKFYVFASKKLNGKNSFPEWVLQEDGVNVEKYVSMILDFYRHMRSEGIEIDILGIDNEINFNEGNITAEKYAAIIDLLKVKLPQEDFKIPLFIGPERYNPQDDNEDSWMNTLFRNGRSDCMDIYGTHYYPRHHNEAMRSNLTREIELSRSDKARPFWATEPHWGVRGQTDKDPVYFAGVSTCTLFDQTDLGMNAMMWWGYNFKQTMQASLMRALGTTIYHSTPIKIEDHDGEDTLDMSKLQTRAFIKGNEINIFVVNTDRKEKEGTNYENYCIGVDKRIKGDVRARRWTGSENWDGESVEARKNGSKSFTIDFPARSITLISFKI